MKIDSIKKYLRSQSIMSRKSTFSNAFASALAPHDIYSVAQVTDAIRDLGQDPKGPLSCVYCGKDAATWDHVFGRVIKGEYSGYGHRIRNLVPCCRECNEQKGKHRWDVWLEKRAPSDLLQRKINIEKFLRGSEGQLDHRECSELQQYQKIRETVFELLKEADRLADSIRQKAEIAYLETASKRTNENNFSSGDT